MRAERLAHNLSQTELAEKVKVSRQTIHFIETAKYIPSTELALRFSKVFDKSVNELFWLEEY